MNQENKSSRKNRKSSKTNTSGLTGDLGHTMCTAELKLPVMVHGREGSIHSLTDHE